MRIPDTSSSTFKACIFGAGAIGGWMGAALARAGCELSAVARGATLQALRTNGLELVDEGGRQRFALRAESEPEALGVQDLVVISVKAPGLADVARRIAPLIGPQTLVLTAMNGVPWWFLQAGVAAELRGRRLTSVDPQGSIAAAMPEKQVIGAVVHASCSLDAAGVVRRHFGNTLILGEPLAEAGQPLTPRLEALTDLLVRGGIDARASTHIQRDAWYKLWGNMTMNPISALTGATTDTILGDELVRDLVTRVMLEAKSIGERLGLPIAETPEDRHAVTLRLGAFKTSMLQDVEAGRPVELDALVGAVRELGQICAMDTPFTDALLGLTRLRVRELGLLPR